MKIVLYEFSRLSRQLSKTCAITDPVSCRAWSQNQTFITDIDGKTISSLELVNSLSNGKIQTVNSLKYHSRTIKQELNIAFKYHYLRHTYGTRLAEMNMPTHILCNQMGHASGKVTERLSRKGNYIFLSSVHCSKFIFSTVKHIVLPFNE